MLNFYSSISAVSVIIKKKIKAYAGHQPYFGKLLQNLGLIATAV